jgi:hypothetical protein
LLFCKVIVPQVFSGSNHEIQGVFYDFRFHCQPKSLSHSFQSS